MWPAWLRQYVRRYFPRAARRPARFRPVPRSRPRLEEFEDRSVPATITWVTAADGQWNTPANWDLNRAPLAGDDVVIPDLGLAGPSLTVTCGNSTSFNSLTTKENVTFGTPLIGVGVTITGGVAIDAGAAVTILARIDLSSPTHVNFSSAVAATNQTVTTTGGGKLNLFGPNAYLRQQGVGHTVTFGSGLTVTTKADTSIGLPGGTGGGVPGTWVNQGTITGRVVLDQQGKYINDVGGLWEVVSSEKFFILPNATWSNAGTIKVTNGTIDLGGSFTTAGIGTFTRTGGTVNLTGTLDNTAATLNLAGPGGLGPVNLLGTIKGGTVAGDAVNVLSASGTNTLDGVTLAAGAILRLDFGDLVTTLNGLTVDGRVEFAPGASSFINAMGTQTYGGSGVIEFAGPGAIRLQQANATLTLGPNLTVRGGQGTILPHGSTDTNTVLINQGTIEGTSAAVAAELRIGTSNFTNTGTVRVIGAKQTVSVWPSLVAGLWSNAGTFSVSAGTLILDGSTKGADVGTFNRTGGTIDIRASIDNTAATLKLAGPGGLGPVILSSDATITGGTIAGDTINIMTIEGTGTSVDGVTINGDTAFGTLASLIVQNDLTVNGTLRLAGSGKLTFRSASTATNQELKTTTGALVEMKGSSGVRVGMQQDLKAHTVTIGSGVTVSALGFLEAIGASSGIGGTWVNEGTIVTKTGGTLLLNTNNTFLNAPGGTWATESGAIFRYLGSWDNDGTITINAGTLELGNTFTTPDIGTVVRTGGTLKLIGTLTNTGTTLTLDGAAGGLGTMLLASNGTIVGGTLTTLNGAKLQALTDAAGTLNGVTISSGSEFHATSASITVLNGLTVDGLLTLADGGSSRGLTFINGSQTLGGTGEVRFTGATGQDLTLSNPGMTLTIGEKLTLRGGNGDVQQASTGTLVNEGTIILDSPGTFTIVPDQFTNGPTGKLIVSHSGATLNLNTDPWSNAGAITLFAGTLNLGGTFTTAGIGTFTRTGGTVNLTGKLNNTGDTLTLDNTTGSWEFNGGWITGGTLATANGSVLIVRNVTLNNANNTLDGVTLDGTANGPTNLVLDLATHHRANVTSINGLTLNAATITIGDAVAARDSGVFFIGSQLVTGTGTIVFGGQPNNVVGVLNAAATITFDTGITIRGKNGFVGNSNSFNTRLDATFINKGLISADTAGGTITLNSGIQTNQGTWQAINGGTLTLAPTSWSNTGVIEVTGGVLNLAGTFSGTSIGDPGRVSRTGGTINLTGILTGGFTLSNAIGDVNFNGGTLSGGAFAVAAGHSARLIGTATTSFLFGVTLASPIDLVTNGTTLEVRNGLTLNTTLPVGNTVGTTAASVIFRDSQSLRTDGGGTIVFGGSIGNQIIQDTTVANRKETLTIGSGVVIRGKNNNTIGRVGHTLINQGRIAADVTGGLLQVLFGTAGVNNGVIEGLNGASLRITGGSGGSWTNLDTISMTGGGTLTLGFQVNESWSSPGTISVTASPLSLRGKFSQAGIAKLQRDPASTITIDTNGTLSGDLTLDDTTGSWRLGSLGTFENGTLRTSGSARLINISNGLLRNVTLNGVFDMTSPPSSDVRIENTLTVNTTLLLGNPAATSFGRLTASGSVTITGTGTIVFAATNAANGIYATASVNLLTIDSGVTILAHAGGIEAFKTIENRGTIIADGATSVRIVPGSNGSFTNRGTVRAVNGAKLDITPGGSAGTTTNLVGAADGKFFNAVLTGGRWEAVAGGIIRFLQNGSGSIPVRIMRLNASVVLDGPGSQIVGSTFATKSFDALTDLTEIGGDGSLTVTNSRNYLAYNSIVSAGDVTVGPGSKLELSDGLAGRWSGEGNANDFTGRHTSTTFGTLTYAPGQVGQAFVFDAPADTIVVTDSAYLRPPRMTIGLWLNRTAALPANGAQFFRWESTVSSSTAYFMSFASTGKLGFSFTGATATAVSNATPLNQWTHIVASFDGFDLRIYQDGTLISTVAAGAILNYVAPGRIVLGGDQYVGMVDEFTIFDRALTPAEVAALSNGGGVTFTQTGGTTTVTGSGSFLSPGDTLDVRGGIVTGTGTINSNVVNSGTIAPGSSPGFIDITGNYIQTAEGELLIEVAGRDANVPEFDRLRVTGTAEVDGIVRVEYLGDFRPAPGDEFLAVTSALLKGTFASHDLPAPGGAGRRLAEDYASTTLTFKAQPVPPIEFGFATVGGRLVAPTAVATDADGSVFVAGTNSKFGDLDGDGVADVPTLPTGGQGYVARFDAAGKLVWALAMQSPTPVEFIAPTGIALDLAAPGGSEVVVVGTYTGTPEISDGVTTVVLPSFGGGQDIYALRLTADGKILWAKAIGSSGDDFATAVAIGSDGVSYATGKYSSAADFDPAPGSSFTLLPGLGGAAFVWALDRSGEFVAADHLSTDSFSVGEVIGTGIAVAAEPGGDSIWFTGSSFGDTKGLADFPGPSTQPDVFVLKIRRTGTLFTTLFAGQYGGPDGADRGADIGIDPAGNAIVAGTFELAAEFDPAPDRAFTLTSGGDTDFFVLKLAADGAFTWARGVGGYRPDSASGVATDAAGNIYVGGTFEDAVDFDPLDGTNILESSDPRGFVTRYDSNGRFAWATDLPAPIGNQSSVSGLSNGADGRVVSVGTASDAAGIDFDPGPGVVNPPPGQLYQAFVWSLRQKAAPVVTIAGLPTGVATEGMSLALAARTTDGDSKTFSYSWTVTRDRQDFASGTGLTFAAYLGDQGIYDVRVTVTDESGNEDTETATVRVTNAAPRLNPTEFATPNAIGGGAGDAFGSALATGDGFIVIGSPAQDPGGVADAGGVAVLTPNGKLIPLTAPTPSASARFGSAVAIVGDAVVVGAPAVAKAYVYEISFDAGADTYAVTFARTITAADSPVGSRFGSTLVAVGNLLAVGAPGRDSNVGGAYLFDPATGDVLRRFENPTPQAGDEFGIAIAAVGGRVLVGSPGDDAAGPDSGAAYLFDPNTGRILRDVFNPNPTFAGSRFGAALAADGLRAVVGAPLDKSSGTTDAGGAFLFDLDPESLSFGHLLATLRSPNAGAGRFGSALSASGNRLLVGADGDTTTAADSGAAFLMDLAQGSPTFGTSVRTFKKPTPATDDKFGLAVGFDGDTVLVGAPADDASAADAGRLYRFAATKFVTTPASAVNENTAVTVSGSFADPGSSDAHTVSIQWNDGTPPTVLTLAAGSYAFTATHPYPDDNPTKTPFDDYAVSVLVTDDAPDLLVSSVIGSSSNRLLRYDGATGVFNDAFMTKSKAIRLEDVAVGPDGNLYVINADNIRFVQKYDGMTGDLLGTFVPPGAGGLSIAHSLTFGPDGSLYVTSTDTSRVVRFQGPFGVMPGLYVDDFVPAGSGGLAIPRTLEFRPDGYLYVLSGGTNSVLRYDGTTGDFVDAFISTGEGLESPREMTFGPNGDLFVVNDVHGTQGVVRYDGATAAFQSEFIDISAGTEGIAFDGRGHILTTTGSEVNRHDAETGEPLGTFTSGDEGILLAPIRLNLSYPQDATSFAVRINNVAPAVVVRADSSGVAGQYKLTATATDASPLDELTYSWTITGGTAVGSTNAASFIFTPTAAAVSVVLTVTDDDTGSVTTRTQVLVGSAAADTITVSNGSAVVNGATITYTAGTSRVVVFGLAGDDSINAGGVTTLPVELVGGFGNDTLTGGAKDDFLVGNNPGDYALADPYMGDTGSDSLSGGIGNDGLDGGLGNDVMAGGDGNDTYIQVPGSDDLLTELNTSGVDTIDYTLAFSGITFSLAQTLTSQVVNPAAPPAEQHSVEIRGQFENLTGSAFTDHLTGNEVDNNLRAGAGDDTLFGGDPLNLVTTAIGDGNDSLDGGTGNDTVHGGSGNDVIFGGESQSTLMAGVGDDDSVAGGSGNDTIQGGAGNDIIFGGEPQSSVMAGVGDDDSVAGGTGNDTIQGGAGNDIIFGGEVQVSLPAGIGDDDSVQGGSGNDTIQGGAGNDIIFGGEVQVSLPAGLGDDDSVQGGSGNDTIQGGAGNDIIFGGEVQVSLPTGGSDDDSVAGGSGNDTIQGGAGNDIIFGGEPQSSVMAGVGDDDSVAGGTGNDTIQGGAGNDIIFGGEPQSSVLAGVGDDDSVAGGSGNDTIQGGAGNDIIFGGESQSSVMAGVGDDDSVAGGTGNDTIQGGAGNDIIFGGDVQVSLPSGITDDDSIAGGAGNDTIRGGAGNDIIFGGEFQVSLAGGTADDDSISGGSGNDTIQGGAGNDIIFGVEGDDALAGGGGIDIFEGGSGTDRVADVWDAAFLTLTPTAVVADGVTERFYDLEQAVLTGGPGPNRLDASTFPGSATLFGLGGNDSLIGGGIGDQLFGGSGDDVLVAGDGPDLLEPGSGLDTVDGGPGNDTYATALGGIESFADAQGIDSLDLSGSSLAVDVDLDRPSAQVFDAAGNVLSFPAGVLENVRGTSFTDVLRGTADRNILEGAGGRDTIDGRAGSDTLHGGFPQLVYLDFDSATGRGEHVYTVEERNLIQARLEALYAAPFNVAFSQTPPSVGRFSRIAFNGGEFQENEVLIGGVAFELDWRNSNAASLAVVNTNGFLGRKGQPAASAANLVAMSATVAAHELGHLLGLRHTDASGPLGINDQTGLPYGIYAGLPARSVNRDELAVAALGIIGEPGPATYHLARGPVLLAPYVMAGNAEPTTVALPQGTVYDGATPIATFIVQPTGAVAIQDIGTPPRRVLGGTLNPDTLALTFQWTIVPAGSSIRVTYQYDAYRPGYRGPDDAVETPLHVMGSPASLGTRVDDTLGVVHFGERELVKLAFADSGGSQQEADLPIAPALGGSARVLGAAGQLPGLSVPNLLPAGAVNAGRELVVRAANVVGRIDLAAGGKSENDVYAVQGKAGELLSVETLSVSLRHRVADVIDGTVRVLDAAGNPLDYYGRPATNDDGIDNQDPILQDVRLPADGTYYIVVDTFTDAQVPDTDVGGYELFVTVIAPPQQGVPRLGGGGDTVIGGPDPDVLVGSAGDDRLVGEPPEDVILGATATDVVGMNEAPLANGQAVVTTEDEPATRPAATDPDGDDLTYELTLPPAHGSVTFDPAANTFTYTPFPDFAGTDEFRYFVTDGVDASEVAVVAVTVTSANDPPVFDPIADHQMTSSDGPVEVPITGVAPGGGADEAGQVVILTAESSNPAIVLNPTVTGTGPTRTLTLQPAANANGQATITVTANDGQPNGTFTRTFVVTVTRVNQPPVAIGGDYFTPGGTSITASAAFDPDTPLDQLSYTLTLAPTFGVVLFNSDGTFTYTPNSGAGGVDTFRFRVSDGEHQSNEAIVTIAVNTTPVIEITGLPATSPEGSLLVAGSSVTDPDPGSGLTYAWSVQKEGKAFASGSGASLPFTPTDNGTYVVVLTVTDGFTATGGDAEMVVVTNVTPTVTLPVPPGVLVGNAIAASGSFFDPAGPSDDDYTYRWRVLHGVDAVYDSGLVPTSHAAGVAALSYLPAAAGRYTVELAVADKDGDADTRTQTVDVSPQATAISRLDSDPTNAATVRFRVTYTDPVAGLNGSHFTVPITGGVVGAAVASVTDDGDGRSWTVTVATGTGDGTVGLALAGTAGLSGPGGVAVAPQPLAGPVYTVDRAVPVVTHFYVTFGNGMKYDLATATRLNLPWRITAIQVEFSEPVTAAHGDLSFVGSVGSIPTATLTGSGTAVLTWTFVTPVAIARLSATLQATGVRDANGNQLAGGVNYQRVFTVLHGDVTGDGTVSVFDLAAELVKIITVAAGTAPYDPFYDMNGDGSINLADYILILTRLGTRLP